MGLKLALAAILVGLAMVAAGLGLRFLRGSRGGRRPDDLTPSAVGEQQPSGMSRAATRGVPRAQLYEEAKRRGIRGRSKMTKAELQAALSEGG
jgi:hypothetical protein